MLKLSTTSALVLLWAGQDVFRSQGARQYLGRLDLEEGRVLYRQCQEVWPYYDEVIKNRKYGVLHFMHQCCFEKKDAPQVIIAGAGLDALGIETTERYPQVRVFEMDRENMALKSDLTAAMEPLARDRIFFLDVDVRDIASVRRRLEGSGWDPGKPTGLVIEGLSYYLPALRLASLVCAVKPRWAIVEFLKQDRDVAACRLDIPRKVFSAIAGQCALPDIEQYCSTGLAELCDMPVAARLGMNELEKMRTGINRLFPTEDSGWIEVCLLGNPAD